MRRVIILCFISLFAMGSLWAQKVVSGKVTDDKGQPLASVSVKSRKTNKGTTTAADGTFHIQVSNDDQLEISIVGFATKLVAVGNNTDISISLEQVNTELSQVVLVGTRSPGRVKTASPVPVDVIDINKFGTSSAKMDLTSALNYAAPSFN